MNEEMFEEMSEEMLAALALINERRNQLLSGLITEQQFLANIAETCSFYYDKVTIDPPCEFCEQKDCVCVDARDYT